MKAIIILLLISSYCTASNGITFELNGGRLGDNILNFCKHQWIAYKYGMLLFVPNFKYKASLPIATLARSSDTINKAFYTQLAHIKQDSQINRHASRCLYIGNFNTILDGLKDKSLWTHQIFKLSIEYPAFGNLLKKMLTPQHDYAPPYKNLTSIAMHIRKGGGYDRPLVSVQYKTINPTASNRSYGADTIHPLKFPPEQYYIEQLHMLYKHLNNKRLYVYIFTDDNNPIEILERIKTHFQHDNIIFDCRKENNSHDQNILLDIYMMSKFDYLIRSASHFPWVSQIIGAHKGIVYPTEYSWQGKYLKINRVAFIQPDRKNNKVVETIISCN